MKKNKKISSVFTLFLLTASACAQDVYFISIPPLSSSRSVFSGEILNVLSNEMKLPVKVSETETVIPENAWVVKVFCENESLSKVVLQKNKSEILVSIEMSGIKLEEKMKLCDPLFKLLPR
jgi:hypothetical protein